MKSHRSSNDLKASLALTVAALGWGAMGSWIALVPPHVSPLVISGVRGAAAAVLLGCLAPRNHNAEKVVGFPRNLIPSGFASWVIALAYAVTAFLLVASVRSTAVGTAYILHYTAPLYVIVLGRVFFSASCSRTDWIAVSAAFLGALLFFADASTVGNLFGNSLAALSGLTWGVCLLFSRRAGAVERFRGMNGGNLLLGVFGLLSLATEVPDGWVWPHLLGIALVGSVIPTVCFVKGMANVSSSLKASLILMLEPLFAAVIAAVALGESLSRSSKLGAAIILCAIAAQAYGNRTVAEHTSEV
ncbi:MAG: EamA family transporter [Bdellovibrionota bacterium]